MPHEAGLCPSVHPDCTVVLYGDLPLQRNRRLLAVGLRCQTQQLFVKSVNSILGTMGHRSDGHHHIQAHAPPDHKGEIASDNSDG
jgi:hypothetical protein